MKYELAVVCVAMSILPGCVKDHARLAPQATQAALIVTPATRPVVTPQDQAGVDQVVATVNGRPITMRQLQKPLVEAYGLNILLNLVQLELVRQDAAGKNIVVTADDIKAEYDMTIAKVFQDATKKIRDDIEDAEHAGQTAKAEQLRQELRQTNEQLLGQFLTQQRISRPEFALAMEANAYLRKIAEPELKNAITETAMRDAYRSMYGEKVQVRHIQCANMQEIGEARRRLQAGQNFAKVAAELSRNAKTAAMGGELPPFTLSMQGLPESFKKTAFLLKEGEVSDPVQADGAYHLIRLERRIEPTVVKFEDVRESIRGDLCDNMMQSAIGELRRQVGKQALAVMQIEEPVLKAQFAEQLARQNAEVTDRQRMEREMSRGRTQTTQPAGPPGPATAPVTPRK